LAAVNDAANAAGGTVGWTYTVDNAKAQYLAKGETVTETYTVTLDDQNGSTTTQDVVITITGTNDIPVLSGAQATLAAGQEDKPYIVNVDDLLKGYTDIDGDSLSVAGITANHGTVVDNLDGTYTVTPTANYNGSITLHYSVTDSHGGISLATQSFVLEAVNDPAIITGETRGSVTEAGSGNNGGTATVTGDLQASDVDNPNDAFQPVATATASANHYGSYTVSPAGVWTYTLDNNNATVNALNSGSSLSDSFKVYSQDGTEQVVQITINGANDIVPVVLPSAYVGADDPNDYDNAGPGPGTLAGVGTNKDDLLVGTNSSTGDTISADNGDDTIYGYGGNDTILGENGKDKIYGGAGNDSIEGNNHEDIIYGGSGNDMLLGHSHNDQLYGGSGSDVINGGEGTDTIYGGYGADQLTGGADADTFVFLSTRDTNDTITDFASTIDKIDLSAIDANTGLASSQGFAWGGQQAGAAVLAHSVTYHAVTGGLVVLADTDGDVSSAEFMLTLTGTTALSEGDFKL
jgi:VCBS repeat-containing protein